MSRHIHSLISFCMMLCIAGFTAMATAQQPIQIQIHWNHVIQVSQTTPSVLFLATPKSKPGSSFRAPILRAIRDLGADDVRYATYSLYPRLAIAELEPPTRTSTSWDFSLVDPMVVDAMNALAGHRVVLNFSTIPEWMIKTPKSVPYPKDPDQPVYDYEQGTELRDPSGREAAAYFARVVSWYVKGGFTDELGKWHESGHHYKIDYWEVLNEPDIEHGFTPEAYTRIYDAVVEAVHKVSPDTKFVGLSNSSPGAHPKFFDYFLNPKNHQPGIPLDMISYHFYAVPASDEPSAAQSFTFFAQADCFLGVTGYIENIRRRLSPHTGTMVNEIGTMLPDDWSQGKPGYVARPIPPSYWNLSGAVYAYVFAGLARKGIDGATESMIPAYPGNFPSIAMLDRKTGTPNARFRILKMIHDNFHPGDKLVDTQASTGQILAQAFLNSSGKRTLLLVNKRDHDLRVNLPEANGGTIEAVDTVTGSNPPSTSRIEGQTFRLGALGVAVVTLPRR